MPRRQSGDGVFFFADQCAAFGLWTTAFLFSSGQHRYFPVEVLFQLRFQICWLSLPTSAIPMRANMRLAWRAMKRVGVSPPTSVKSNLHTARTMKSKRRNPVDSRHAVAAGYFWNRSCPICTNRGEMGGQERLRTCISHSLKGPEQHHHYR